MDVEDIGHSKLAQLNAIEEAEKGEKKKGLEIIKIIPGMDEDLDPDNLGLAVGAGGPHKLMLEDANGVRVFGFEYGTIEGVGIGMNIGCKMAVRDVIVRRGVLMLDSKNTTILGGKVDEIHKKWREERKDQLKSWLKACKEEMGEAKGPAKKKTTATRKKKTAQVDADEWEED